MAKTIAKIMGLNLALIASAAQAEVGLTDDQAERGVELYKQFLVLKAKNPNEKLVPPKLVDHIWHQHIMHSEQYVSDMNEIFGRYLHHNPTKGVDEAAYSRTKELYKQEFAISMGDFGGSECNAC